MLIFLVEVILYWRVVESRIPHFIQPNFKKVKIGVLLFSLDGLTI